MLCEDYRTVCLRNQLTVQIRFHPPFCGRYVFRPEYLRLSAFIRGCFKQFFVKVGGVVPGKAAFDG
jgi:hypothetical protein